MNDELSDDELLEDLPVRKPEPKETTNARNEREHWLDLTAKMLGKPIPMIAKKVEGWPMIWVRDIYLYVNRAEVKNPPALWWHLYNNPKP